MPRLSLMVLACLLAGATGAVGETGAARQLPLFPVTIDDEFPEAARTFDEVRELILSKYYSATINEDALYWSAIKGMLAHLSPPDNPQLAALWSPAEYARILDTLRGVQVSIGIKSTFNPQDGSLTVTEVLPGSPGAGVLRPLDRIMRLDGIALKGKQLTVSEVARRIRCNYVLEGSVRKAGNRVRITVQLIDAETDRHIWAERYDRELADIFAIQDELTAAIASTLPGRVEAASRDRAARKPPDDMAAYECVLAAKVLHHRSAKEDNAKALRLIERAIELDPVCANVR